jgi:hypothetical protein
VDKALDIRRWREKPAGVNYRRWVIVSTGLRQLYRTRFFQVLLFLAWLTGIFVAAAGFVFTQTLATGGWLETWATELGPRAHAVVSAICSLVLLYPDICIHGLFTSVLWMQASIGFGLSVLALTAVLPRLIAKDRASNALTIYLSRPLTTFDYLIGKLGVILGILFLLWTGPLLLGWALSMALAPNADFFVYSLTPLLRALMYNAIAVVVLAAVSLGISSLGKTTRAVTVLWIVAWIVLGAVANIPGTPAVVRAASFSQDLSEVKKDIFRLDEILVKAGKTLPIANREISENMIRAGEQQAGGRSGVATAGLVGLVIASSLICARRLRPE